MSEQPESDNSYERDDRGRFVEGNRGGPGRPKGEQRWSLKRAIEDAIASTEREDGKTILDSLAVTALRAAQGGDFRFWNAILDRLDGPVKQHIEQEQTVWIERITRAAKTIEGEDSE